MNGPIAQLVRAHALISVRSVVRVDLGPPFFICTLKTRYVSKIYDFTKQNRVN